MHVHTVFFTLKPGYAPEQIEKMIRMAKAMEKVETVKALYVGRPAPVAKRPVTRDDYDVCLTVLFDSIADHDVYQDHPLHDEFIAANKDLWEKVAVYDAS